MFEKWKALVGKRGSAIRLFIPLLVAMSLAVNQSQTMISWILPKTAYEQQSTSWLDDKLLGGLLYLKNSSDVATPRVTAISFSSGELKYLETNLCDGRELMGELITELNRLGRSMIVIDKTYDPASCSNQASNNTLLTAMKDSRATLVVGRPAEEKQGGARGWGYAFTQSFDFLPKNVLTGLTITNSDPRQIPLQWPVFDAVGGADCIDDGSAEKWCDSLPLAAAHVVDPSLSGSPMLWEALTSHEHPYMDYTHTSIAEVSTADILCASNAKSYPNRPPGLLSKCKGAPFTLNDIVVIGDESERDRFTIAGEKVYGFRLHAEYVEALLNRSFFRKEPRWWMALAVVWSFVAPLCFTLCGDNRRPLLIRCNLVFLAFAAVLVVLEILLRGYFPPSTTMLFLASNVVATLFAESANLIANQKDDSSVKLQLEVVEKTTFTVH